MRSAFAIDERQDEIASRRRRRLGSIGAGARHGTTPPRCEREVCLAVRREIAQGRDVARDHARGVVAADGHLHLHKTDSRDEVVRIVRVADLLPERHQAGPLPDLVVARTTQQVGDAIAILLQEYGISQLPVSEAPEGDDLAGFVGSITEKGLLDRAFRDPTVVERTVGEVMDKPLPFVDLSARLDEAFALLSAGSSDVIATSGDRPIGIVTKLDLLEYLAHRPNGRG